MGGIKGAVRTEPMDVSSLVKTLLAATLVEATFGFWWEYPFEAPELRRQIEDIPNCVQSPLPFLQELNSASVLDFQATTLKDFQPHSKPVPILRRNACFNVFLFLFDWGTPFAWPKLHHTIEHI